MVDDVLVQTLFCIPVLIFNGYIALRVHHWMNKRREVRFLKHLKIKYPDCELIFSAIATSDAQAMAMLEEQLDLR
jgi:hypothetical protein